VRREDAAMSADEEAHDRRRERNERPTIAVLCARKAAAIAERSRSESARRKWR
jgi:hypothetical protein